MCELLGGSHSVCSDTKEQGSVTPCFPRATPSPRAAVPLRRDGAGSERWKQVVPVLPSQGPGTSGSHPWNSDVPCRCDESPSSEKIRSERSAFCRNSKHGTDFPGLQNGRGAEPRLGSGRTWRMKSRPPLSVAFPHSPSFHLLWESPT